MAESKPISYSQIADPNLLNPLKKELEEVNKLLGITEESLKDIINEAAKISKATPLDSFENLEKVEKGLQDATKAVKDLDKVEKDRVRLQEKIKELDDDRVKANFDLREQIRLQTKELRDNAKAAAASGDAYEVLKKRTNEAQAEAKKLAAEFGENSKQAKEAVKRFENLDDQLDRVNKRMRDGRRHVGRYERGVQGLTRTFRTFAKATIILEIFQLLQNSIRLNSDGLAAFEKIWVRVTTVIEVAARGIVEIFPIIEARTERLRISTALTFLRLRENITSAVDGIREFFGQDTSGSEKLSKRISDLEKEYQALARTAGKDLGKVFENLGDQIADLTAKKIQLIDDTLAYRREIVGLEQDIAKLIPTQEKLRAGFEDDSTSLEEQIRAGVALQEELQRRFSLEETIASRRLELAQDNAKANIVNVGAQEELSAATLEYNQLIANQASELAATEREIQKLRDDATQLNLDFYIDDFDNRKTVNERIIADETQTFARRKQLLEENLKGAEEVFDLEEEALNKSLAERGKAQLDFDELRQKSSSEEIARIIRESGISEPLAIRALEVLRERRTFLQDNAESQRDLNAAEAESRLIQSDILLQQEALNRLQERGVDLEMVLATLADARLQNEIDNIRAQIALIDEATRQEINKRIQNGERIDDLVTSQSAERLKLNQELNDKLIEQDQNALNKRKKQLQEFGQAAQEAFSLLSDITRKRSEERQEGIEKELSAEQARAERLRELAANGNEDAENNLALTEQRQAELELRRQQQIKRQERQELTFAAIQTFSAKVQAGDPNPLASTISDISVLRAFINSLPGFFEGTEDTGTAANPIDRKGGRMSILHDNERVIDKANNRIIGKMSNTELAMIANREKLRSKKETSVHVVQELRELKQITRDKPAYLGSDYDHIADSIIRKVQRGNKLERIHRKNGGIWG